MIRVILVRTCIYSTHHFEMLLVLPLVRARDQFVFPIGES